MEQKPFDKSIKDSLENLEVAYNADHWQQMESLLNNLPIGDTTDIDAHFDALIKNKINTIDAPVSMEAWANIESALIQTEATDLEFDTAINNKISTIQGTTPAWDNIAQALDKKEGADIDFDKEIYSKLNNLAPTSNTSSWQRILAKLNADFALREKLYRYKLMEATLMILLLLNFYQYLPTNYSNHTIENVAKQTQEVKFQSQDLIIAEENSIDATVQEAIVSPKTEDLAEANVSSKDIVESSIITNDEVNNNEEISKENILSPTAAIIERNYAITSKLSKLSPSFKLRSGLNISVSEMNHHLTLHTETGNTLINTVPSLRPNFVESQYITPLGCQDCKYSKIPARLRLGLIANIASTNAYVTGGQLLDINAFNQKGFGYGSGFSLGFKYGRWELETGLKYAAKQYDPNIIEETAGSIKRTHFQTVYLQTLHIPANLRYNYAVLGKGRWHLYAQTGAALNVVLRAEYDLPEISSRSRSITEKVTSVQLDQVSFNKGLFAGDGFKKNRYLSISMGAGVERYITPSWSIFMQPDFHFHFSGNRIGPTDDRINTLSLSFGARKSL